MTSAVLAGGFASNADGLARGWCVTPDRKLYVVDMGAGPLDPAAAWGVKQCPLPGDAKPLAFDPFRSVMLFDDASALRLDSAIGRRPRWKPLTSYFDNRGGNVVMTTKASDGAPVLMGASSQADGSFVGWDRDRRLYHLTSVGGRVLAGGWAVPGQAPILAVSIKDGVTALVGTGERFSWEAGNWRRNALMTAEETGVTVRVREAFALGGETFNPGDVRMIPADDAKRLSALGTVTPLKLSA